MADVTLAANNPDLGGGEQMLVRCATALIELDHNVRVVSPATPSEVLDAAADAGAEPVALPAMGRRGYMQALRTWHAGHRPQIMWCHGLVPALATAGRPGRIVHLHQRPRSTGQWAALSVARRRALRVLAPSHTLAVDLRAQALPNWTDEIALAPKQALSSPVRVGYLGRLWTQKGLDLLAGAVSHAGMDPGPEIRLVVAGDSRWVPPEELKPVTSALTRLGDRVQLLGRTTPTELFAQIDLLVVPSRVSESFGLVAAEAMAHGTPLVVSDAGALPEVVGRTHPWVFESGNLIDLSRTISTAITADPSQRARIVGAARGRWEHEYSPCAGRDRVRDLLQQIGAR